MHSDAPIQCEGGLYYGRQTRFPSPMNLAWVQGKILDSLLPFGAKFIQGNVKTPGKVGWCLMCSSLGINIGLYRGLSISSSRPRETNIA